MEASTAVSTVGTAAARFAAFSLCLISIDVVWRTSIWAQLRKGGMSSRSWRDVTKMLALQQRSQGTCTQRAAGCKRDAARTTMQPVNSYYHVESPLAWYLAESPQYVGNGMQEDCVHGDLEALRTILGAAGELLGCRPRDRLKYRYSCNSRGHRRRDKRWRGASSSEPGR